MMRYSCCVIAAAFLFACTGSDLLVQDVVPQDAGDDTNTNDTSGVTEDLVQPLDLVQKETFLTDIGTFDLPDFAAPEVPPPCQPGEGCFLDNCLENSDCQSGWCVQHLGEAVCSQPCQDECPDGWVCSQVAGTEPDVVYICVSNYANLCRPCSANSDCTSLGGAKDACLDYGTDGDFCGGLCGELGECPWGFTCQEIQTVQGAALMQCVYDSGQCPCTTGSVALGLATTCESTNEFGTCIGQRVCVAEGLSPCDAAVAAPETCNGIDDDCDGEIDEPGLVDGLYIPLCDDGNDCTSDVCTGEEGCTNELLDSGDCTDENPCTVADHCEAGECIGDPVQCDDENPCTDNVCTDTGGCEYPAQAGPCDDGNPCTVADQCDDAVCAGTAVSCDCQVDEDCLALEDGDVCNGMLFCDTGKLPFVCAVSPDTVVSCPQPEGPAAVCLEPSCNPDSGDCGFVPANPGFLCDDSDLCTTASTCLDGECAGGSAVNCNDGNPCTDDLCQPDTGCVYVANNEPCDDGDVCTTSDICDQTECIGTNPLNCDDQDACNGSEVCDPEIGCVPGEPLVCVDDDVCNGAEGCDPLQGCLPGVPLVCDDGNLCDGVETCDPLSGCLSGQPLDCADQDACNGAESCDPALGCLPGEPLVCDDGNACDGVETCDPDIGCVPGDALVCDDADACNGAESCDPATGCTVGVPLDCDDGNACDGVETCDPDIGCVPGDALVCDDTDACNGTESCQTDTGCAAGIPLECDDGNPCTDDSCAPDTGCVHTNNNAQCDDQDVCTTGEVCADGVCGGGVLDDCDDGNPCTEDTCDPDLGCLYTMNQAVCDDEDVCTTQDQCQLGKCIGSAPLSCNDNNSCTDDTCDPEAGCQFLPNDAECSDNSECTTGDHCLEGLCVVTGILTCKDENVCTDDSCDPAVGCVFAANIAPCTDDTVCTVGDICQDKSCISGAPLVCNDSNLCTDDICDPIAGCVFTANSAPCDDNDLCTPFDQCLNNVCVGSGLIDCDDLNLCTDDSCLPDVGCVNDANTLPCDDNSECTTADACVDKQCAGGPDLDCDDLNDCTTDDCDPDTGCTHIPVPDDTPCPGGNICKAGECVSPCIPGSQTFSYTGSEQTFLVPGACAAVSIEVWGAEGNGGSGGATGGKGGHAAGDLTVTPGETLYLHVGGKGAAFNGGGSGGSSGGGTGGGASDVRKGGNGTGNRVIVAGGGGGGGGRGCNGNHLGGNGGYGGGGTGGKGQDSPNGGGGFGGAPGSGGKEGVGCHYALGSPGNAGGKGGDGQSCCCGTNPGGGGGGGGYQQAGGGGGGSAGTTGCGGNDKGGGGGGGGGTNHTGGMTGNASTENGVRSGNGQVTISW